jgi:predicted lipoprotein with Yx(FWY)xxD motif
MRIIALLLLTAALAVAGCGDDDGDTAAKPQSDDAAMKKDDAEAMKKDDAEAMKKDDAAMKKDDAAMKKDGKGATITLADSQFGPMLFDSNKQAIYVFENDRRNETVCYDECAEEWPPVFTEGAPRAANGVKESLLGTVKRRDGRTQVTYAGKPLYFYAHEDPGVVLCHNVDLNGGLWWAVGADGKPRPT